MSSESKKQLDKEGSDAVSEKLGPYFDPTKRKNKFRVSEWDHIDQTEPFKFQICPLWDVPSSLDWIWFDTSCNRDYTGDQTGQRDPRLAADRVKVMYPEIVSELKSWATVYQKARDRSLEEKTADQLRTGAVFNTNEDRIVWQTRGMLIACWLARQQNVEQVQYLPETQVVRLSHNNQEQAWRELFGIHDKVLRAVARGESTDNLFMAPGLWTLDY